MPSKILSVAPSVISALPLGAGHAAAAEDGKAALRAADGAPPQATVQITRKDCQRLMVAHRPRDDVAYKPETEIRGRKILPPDVGGSFQMPLPEVFEFNITRDLNYYLGKPEADEAVQGAQTIYDAAVAAYVADPTDATKKAAVSSASTALSTAQSALTSAQTSAASGDSASAITPAASAVSAAEDVGYTEDADVTALRTSASSLNTSASSAASEATETSTANTATAAADKEAASIPDMQLHIGTVRFNRKTGALHFNGQPMNDTVTFEIAEKCRALLRRRR